MTPEQYIYQALTSDSTVASYVGNRVYPSIPEQDSLLPYVVYQRQTTSPIHTLTELKATTTLIQLDYWTQNEDQIVPLGNAILAALDIPQTSSQCVFLEDRYSTAEEDYYHETSIYSVSLNQ